MAMGCNGTTTEWCPQLMLQLMNIAGATYRLAEYRAVLGINQLMTRIDKGVPLCILYKWIEEWANKQR